MNIHDVYGVDRRPITRSGRPHTLPYNYEHQRDLAVSFSGVPLARYNFILWQITRLANAVLHIFHPQPIYLNLRR